MVRYTQWETKDTIPGGESYQEAGLLFWHP
jgi:hypothetical protein